MPPSRIHICTGLRIEMTQCIHAYLACQTVVSVRVGTTSFIKSQPQEEMAKQAELSFLHSLSLQFSHLTIFEATFPGGSEVKVSACVCLQYERPGFDSWVGKIHWRRKWQPTPVFFPGESHGRRSLVGYSPQGVKESDMTERLHFLPSSQRCLMFSRP